MIRLEIEEYCHECLDFNPNVIPGHREPNGYGSGYFMTDTIVECKNRNRCVGIKRYLERQTRKEFGFDSK